MGDYERLEVWKLADELVLSVYRVTRRLPGEERFGLTAQIRRAAVSIPSNIAEGCGRNTAGDLRQFLRVALGSANELTYQLSLATRLGYTTPQETAPLHLSVERIRQMLARLIVRVSDRPAARRHSVPRAPAADHNRRNSDNR